MSQKAFSRPAPPISLFGFPNGGSYLVQEMEDDRELLRRYAQESSQDGFRELVRRHVGLVYNTALRRCGGDAHRAHDIAQVVFTDMARKARSLQGRQSLAAWLHTSARYAAAQMIRTEVRRKAREESAHAPGAPMHAQTPPADWETLRPVLDEALGTLGEQDQSAVLLRYFEGLSFADVAARLNTTEDGARMRVDRALGKLRRVLCKRGVTSSASALAAALEANAATAAPTGLAASIATSALAGAAGGTTAGAALFLTMAKIKTFAVIAVVAAGATGLLLQHQELTRLRSAAADARSMAATNASLLAENERLRSAAKGGGATGAAAGATAEARLPKAAHAGSARDTAALAPGLSPVTSLGDQGRGSPRAVFATQLWAARTGEVELEASTLLLRPDDKSRLAELLPALPSDIRDQCGTPEALMAFVLAGSPHPVGGMAVLGETDQGPDDATLQTQWQHADDSIVHQSTIQFHRDSGAWRMVVPSVLVDRAVVYLRNH